MATRKNTRAGKARPRSVQPASDEQLAGIMAFQKSPHGVALAEAERELENGIAMGSILLQTLEATPGSEQEATVLRLALERLEKAANHLDEGSSGSALVSVPKPQEGTVVSLTAFPHELKNAVIKTIHDATGMELWQVKRALNTLPATFLALLSNSVLVDELVALGATATVVQS